MVESHPGNYQGPYSNKASSMAEPDSGTLEILKHLDYYKCIQDNQFWISLAKENPKIKDEVTKKLKAFFKCTVCKQEEAGSISPCNKQFCYRCISTCNCTKCKARSKELVCQCLECFRHFSQRYFEIVPCKHYCDFCGFLETSANPTLLSKCKICKGDLGSFQSYQRLISTCNGCHTEIKGYGNINRLSCDHIYCETCIQNIQKSKQCSACKKTLLTTDNFYISTMRKKKFCGVCGLVSEAESISKSRCCNQYVCLNCKNSRQCVICETSID